MKWIPIATLLILAILIPATDAQSISPQLNEDEVKILVVAVYPYDTPPQTDISGIEDILSNIASFIDTESFGKLEASFTVKGWKRLPDATQAYVSNFSISEYINTLIIPDTLDTLSDVDSSEYDCLVIIHSGQSYQKSYFDWGIYNCGLNHQYHSGLRTTERVAIVSELEDLSTYVKYILHSFGSPYLFWGWGWDTVGIYTYGIMGGGKAGLCGFTKESLGFIEQDAIYNFESGTKQILLKSMSSQGSGYRIVKYQISEKEYYMIEARLNQGYDTDLPIHGILITYVNETAFDIDGPGIKVLRRDDCNLFTHAPLMVGESYCDLETGLTVKFIEETYQGAHIIISNTPILEWSYVERIVVPECESIRNIQLVWDYDEFMDDTHLYMSVEAKVGSNNYLRVYDSTDYGRTWIEIFSTLGEANVSSNDGALIRYENEVLYASSIQREGLWYPALTWKSSYNDNLYYTNLSLLTNARIYPWMDAVADNSTLYLAAFSILNDTAVTYLKLDENGWANSTLQLNLGSDFTMLNPVDNKRPNILFRNGTGFYITSFNSSDVNLLTPELVWNIYGLEDDYPYTAFSVIDGDDEWYRCARIVNGSLQTIFQEKSFVPRCQSLSTYNNSIAMIVRDLNGTYIHLVKNESYTKENISENFSYAMSRVTPIESVWNPIIAYKAYSDSRIYTAHFEYTTPSEYEQVFWGEESDRSDIYEVSFQIVIVSSTVVGIGCLCSFIGILRNKASKGKRW